MGPLYLRLLGDRFERLSPALRAFHGAEHGASARGTMRVARGAGFFHRVVGRLGGLPDAGDVPLRLEVKVEDHGERWIRHFGAHRVESVQWCERGLFAETAGPLFVFLFRLDVDDEGALHFRFERVRFLGIPLPRFASPSGHAVARSHPEGFYTEVELRAPLLGTILRYEGVVRPLAT